MAGELGKAYVTIVPKLSNFAGTINKGVASAGSSGGSQYKGGFMKGVAAGAIGSAVGTAMISAAKAGASAVTSVLSSALGNYAEYEQLTGGVETLFKGSASTVQQYAADAYKTAGLSANEYMNTVTSFSASLLQSLGGDTDKAAQKANVAITDMSDNANKMGTSMESIQNAYQGFAKQNYTMLDNLKLGYGGTKSEMERLLSDAEKISGIKYDISSYSDIVDAIHVVQTEMGITGTTAQEAATTIEGSVNSMKSAWQNWLTGLGADNANMEELTTQLIDSVVTAASNIVPRLMQILTTLATTLSTQLPPLVTQLGALVSTTLPQILPPLIEGITGIIVSLAGILPTLIPILVSGAMQLFMSIVQALPEIIPQLVDALVSAVQAICDMLPQLVPQLLSAAIILFMALAQAVPQVLGALLGALGSLLQAGFNAVADGVSGMLTAAGQMMQGMIDGIGNALANVLTAIGNIKDGIFNFFAGAGTWLLDSGRAIIQGLADGIAGAVGAVVDAVGGVLSAARNLLPFSPAKEGPFSGKGWTLYSGMSIIEALGDGITKMGGTAVNAMYEVMGEVANAASADVVMGGRASMNALGVGSTSSYAASTQIININQPCKSPAQTARAIRLQQTYGLAGAR